MDALDRYLESNRERFTQELRDLCRAVRDAGLMPSDTPMPR